MYNLIQQPWLQLLEGDEVSLKDALLNAHKIQGIQGATSMIVAAQYRVLLAIIHRAIEGPKSIQQWVDLWNQGNFEQDVILAYLSEWKDGFELYGSWESPGFMQAIPASIPEINERDVNKIVLHGRAGNNVCLFGLGSPMVLTPGQAARNLVAIQAFALGGGSSGLLGRNFTDGPCARGIVCLLLGRSLFETLMFNLLPYPETGVQADSKSTYSDRPIWERSDPFDRDPLSQRREKLVPRGLTDLYTWPSRRVVLIPDEDATANRMQFSSGLRLGLYKDPQQYYQGKKTLRMQITDRGSTETTIFDILPAVLGENHIPAVSWLDRLCEAGCEVKPQWLGAFGQAGQQGAMQEEKTFICPYPITTEEREIAQSALAITQKAENKLWAGLGRAMAIRNGGLTGRKTDLRSVQIPPGWRGEFRRNLQKSYCILLKGKMHFDEYLTRVTATTLQVYSTRTSMYSPLAMMIGEGVLQGGLRKAGLIKKDN